MSMYKIYIDDLLLPMGTDKLETSISDRDDERELIDGEVISVIKSAGLTTWKFNTLIAPYKISGGCYENGRTITTNDLLNKLEALKVSKMPFQFKVIRSNDLGDTDTTVTLKDYKRVESTETSLMSEVEINLRVYKSHINTSIDIELPEKPTEDPYLEYEDEIKRLEALNPPSTYFVKLTTTTVVITPPGMPGVPGTPIISTKLPSWMDIGKELFGDTKYGYGIRNTNNTHWNDGSDTGFPLDKYPGMQYPKAYSTLKINVPEIVVKTAKVMESPENLR